MDNGSDLMDNITDCLVFLFNRFNERNPRRRYLFPVCNETESERADHKEVNLCFFFFTFPNRNPPHIFYNYIDSA